MWNRAQHAAWHRLAAILGLLLWLGSVPGWAREHESGPAPLLRIPVAPLGYRPPGKIYLLAHFSSSSLDFLDDTHLLFTFHEPRLLERPEHSTGLEQVIHAVVLELPSGKVTAETHWLLHDRHRYLWPAGQGRAMLRIGDELYTADAGLILKPLFHADAALREVALSPDGRMLMVETDAEKHTPEQHARLVKHAEEVGADPPEEGVHIRLVRLDPIELKMTARADAVGNLPANADGFFSSEKLTEERWNVRFHPFGAQQSGAGEIVAQVSSTCQPDEQILSEQSVLVMSCPPKREDRFVAAYALQGHKLWDGRWQSNFAWPSLRMASSGNTVAISWLALGRPVSVFDAFDDGDVQAQVLSVLDSRTGTLRLAMPINPIMSAGGNFALSRDGNRLAILNRGAIEIYDLPPAAPSQERAAK